MMAHKNQITEEATANADGSTQSDGRPLRALVLGVNEHPRAVACVRSLGRAGIPLIGVKSDAFTHECHSRYLQRTYLVCRFWNPSGRTEGA